MAHPTHCGHGNRQHTLPSISRIFSALIKKKKKIIIKKCKLSLGCLAGGFPQVPAGISSQVMPGI